MQSIPGYPEAPDGLQDFAIPAMQPLGDMQPEIICISDEEVTHSNIPRPIQPPGHAQTVRRARKVIVKRVLRRPAGRALQSTSGSEAAAAALSSGAVVPAQGVQPLVVALPSPSPAGVQPPPALPSLPAEAEPPDGDAAWEASWERLAADFPQWARKPQRCGRFSYTIRLPSNQQVTLCMLMRIQCIYVKPLDKPVLESLRLDKSKGCRVPLKEFTSVGEAFAAISAAAGAMHAA